MWVRTRTRRPQQAGAVPGQRALTSRNQPCQPLTVRKPSCGSAGRLRDQDSSAEKWAAAVLSTVRVCVGLGDGGAGALRRFRKTTLLSAGTRMFKGFGFGRERNPHVTERPGGNKPSVPWTAGAWCSGTLGNTGNTGNTGNAGDEAGFGHQGRFCAASVARPASPDCSQ